MVENEVRFDDVLVDTSFGKMHALVSRSSNQSAECYVLLHGLLVSASYMEPTARVLGLSNTVFIPNMLGHGKSETPKHALNIKEHAASLSEFLRAQNILQPVLIGGSYGCNIAAELAASHGVNSKALVLIGPTDVHGRSVQSLLGDLVKDGFFEPPIMVPTVIGDVSRIGIERCLDQLRYMSEHDMDDALLRCGIPILLIKGEHDLLSSEEIVRDKFEIIPDCQAINVIGSAHCLSVSDPELCAEMIEDFVNQGDLNDVYRAA